MTVETFAFPYHQLAMKWPQGDSVAFGGGYQFAARPVGPPQRTLTLTMVGLQWFRSDPPTPTDPPTFTAAFDLTTHPERNAALFTQFYQTHETWKTFIYKHEQFGDLTVRFATPLEMPKAIVGGTGVLPEFEVTLIEQPS